MKKIRITFTLFIALFTFLNIQAQDQFERLYRSTDWENLGLDIVQTGDMGFLLLSIGKHPDSMDYKHSNITKLDPKGDIEWSKNYDFEDVVLANGELTLLENDSFAFSVLCFKVALNKVVTKADPSGEVVWTTKVGETIGPTSFMPTGTGDLISTSDGGFALFDIASKQPAGSLPMMSKLDTAGNLLWTNIYESDFGADSFNQQTFDAEGTIENGFILGGAANELVSNNAFLMNLDSLGEVNWGKRYNLEVGNLFASNFLTVESTLDSGYVAGGTYTNTFQQTSGWILKVDSIGRVLWSYLINDPTFTAPNNLIVNSVISNQDGSVTALGVQSVPSIFLTRSFALNISPDGTINWQNYYFENQDVQFTPSLSIDNLIATQDGGSTAYGYIVENDGAFGTLIPYLLKIDQNGESSCQDTTAFISGAINVLVDSLNVVIDTLNGFDTTTIEAETYGKFSVPILSLEAPSFCEGEPILHTFDATVPGAVSYEWNTGDTTAMITVTQEGMYTVQVRVEEDICFTMCDTTMITVTGPPTAEIISNTASYCDDGVAFLQAQGGGTFEWSTGETASTIAITELGTYFVTVTNQCGSSSTNISIALPNLEIEQIFAGLDSFCTSGVANLLPVLTANSPIPNSYEWSTGETTPTISVNEPGTYSVLISSNNCGNDIAEVMISPCISTFDCVEIPNAFTPDGDQNNDSFWPIIPEECADIEVTEIKIYSRWGELVFETDSPNLRWDGNYKDEPAASDVYVYSIKFVNGIGERGTRSGDLTLLR